MSLSVAKFIDGLSQIGLLPPAEIDSLKATLADKLEADADGLARELVEQGKLSRFQAAAVYQGRAEALVLGNYLVIDKLGAGGMGQVFRARHRRMDRVVALKVLSKKQLGSPEAVARFQREVKAAARLTHPHIVTAYDADEAAGMLYLVMEYVEGQDLSAIVKAGGPLSVPKAVDYVIQAARGLEHAHSQGIIHRDVKPSNLLLDKQGTVKILDMGLARVDNPLAGPDSGEGLTAAGSVMGTVDFMSPEQALDTAQADARSDIYSLGYTLYYLITGKKPYDADTAMKKLVAHREKPTPSLTQERPEVSADLEAVYRKLVAKRPEQRYATMREAREALEAVQAGRRPLGGSGQASPVPMAARLSEPPQEFPRRKKPAKAARSKTPLIAGVAAVVLLLGIAAVVLPGMLSKEPAQDVALADASPKVEAATNIAPAAKPASEPSKPLAVTPAAEPDGAKARPEPAENPTASDNPALPADQPTPPAPNQPAVMTPSPIDPTAPALPPPEPPLADPASAPPFTANPAVTAADSEPAAETTPNADVPAVPADPAIERKAAEWVLGLGGKVEVFVGGRTIKVARANLLPMEPFTVTLVDFSKIREVNDESLANLDALSHLVTVILTETSIGNGAGSHFARHAWLKALHLGTTGFGDGGIEQLAPLTRLELFRGNHNPITDRGAQSLAQHKSLRDVFLLEVPISDVGLGYLCQLQLTKLQVDGSHITDAGLKDLQQCKGLLILHADRTAITDAGLELVATLPVLRWLGLRDTRITDRSVETLAGMKALDSLYLSDPPISQAGYEKLRALLPKCKIELSRGNPSAVASSAPAKMVPLDPSKRLAVPSADEQQNAVSLVKDVFGDELAQAKKPEDRAALAEKLLKKAQESRDDPASAYALLDMARGLAVDAAEAPLLAKIDMELGSRFELEPLELLADDLEKAAAKAHPPAAFKAVSELALQQVDEALAADDFALAKRLGDVAITAGRKAKDQTVLKSAIDRGKSLSAAKQQWDAAEAAQATLATTPDDPGANLALGRFLCFVKGDWATGFANLAKGSDDTLKELAAKSAADPQDAAGQAALGEAWADAADSAKGKSKADLQAGARYWLSKALPATTGLAKAKVEQRLKQLGTTGAGPASANSTASRSARRPAAGTLGQQLARDRAAAEWVLGIRGKVGIMAPNFSGEQTVELLADLPQQPFALVNVNLFKSTEVTDEGLKHLENLTNITNLRLDGSGIGDMGLANLKDLTSLQLLQLSTTKVTDAGLVNLRGLKNLTDLSLDNRPITGVGLEAFKDLRNLRILRLSNTRIKDADLSILRNNPKLEVLRLNNTMVTDAALGTIGGLTQLKSLILADTKVTDAGLPKLYPLQNLKTLYLQDLKLGDAAIAKLKAALPQCKIEF